MEKMNIVRNTITEGTLTYRERSRIGSINHRIWSVIAPMLFVLCTLFGVNEMAWATWPTFRGSVSTPDNGTTYYVLYEGSSAVGLMNDWSKSSDKSYNLGGPGAEVTFDLQKTSNIATGSVYVYAGEDTEIESVGITSFASKNNWKGFSGDMSEYCSTKTSIKFHANGTLTKKVRNAKVKMFSGVLQPSLTSGSWTFTTADYAAEDLYKDFTVDWSNLESLPLSKAVNGSSDDRSQFSYEIFSNTQTLAKGKYGTATIRVKYKHDKVGTHSVKIKVGDYTITFTGTTNKITPYIETTPTVDTITYGQTISNSQLGTGLVKADLINAAGTVVPGTWTIDENGQTVTTSGGSNATVHLTFTPTDRNTYNTIHTTQLMFVRSVATISWASAYSAEKPTVPVGKWIENAATTNAAGAVITYSSTNPNVEISADGHSFRFTAESEAEVVASHGVTATHGSASETKTFKSTYKAIQVIKWADRFDRLTTEMTTKSLVAEVWIENALTGVRTYSAERTALLQYSSANSSVVSIPVNSTTLHIEGKGTTTITAFVEGDEYYEEASVTMPVKVREPSDGCDYPLWEKDHEGDKDHLYEFFQMNKDEIISPEYDIRMEGQYPDKLSFSHKGEYYNVVGLSFWKYYSGPIKAQQKIGDNWVNVTGSEVTPAISDWGETSDLQLDERATHIRFVRPQGGEGHHYIKNVTVSRKHFIRTETPEVDFGNTIKVNSSEYRDVVINYANVQDVLKVTNPFSQDITVDDVIDVDSCGAAGSAVLRIYFSPTSLATVDDYITIKDEVKNSTLSIHVKADAQRADQTITWNPDTELLATETIELNGTTNGQEHGVMNVITYTVTNNDDVISVTNNVVTVLKPGTVTITATQNGSANYEAADPVEKNFTISAETLTIKEAPVAGDITYGQTLSASTLTGGSVEDSKHNPVAGSFSWQVASTQPNAGSAQNFVVVFTPEENAAWYNTLTTSVAVNVAAAAPVATPSAANIVYGQKVSESELSNDGTEGTWSWTDAKAEAVLAAGTYNDLAVHFTPTSGNYIELDATVSLTVEKANPEVTAQASAITYGQAISASELSTASGEVSGTWAWSVDETQVLSVGNHALKANFTSANANYNDLSNVDVTLTVNKIEQLEVPVALSFCAGGSVTFHGNTYTEAGEYQIEAEGATRDTVYNVTVTKLQPTTGTDSRTITVGANESWNGINLSGYAVGSHEVEFHTTNAAGCDSTVTLSLTVVPLSNVFTNAEGDGDWDNANNWESGIVPTSDPDIIVTGALEINESITVGSLTIESTGSVAVISGGTLTVNGTSEARAEYGDVHVMRDGEIALGNSANLQVRDFTLDASLGNSSNTATSGQVSGHNAMNINGKAYFELTFDPSDAISFGWYDFTVPFKVNIAGGIARIKSIDDKEMVSGVDFMIMEADEQNRANGGKGWRNVNSGALQPGKLYTITFNYQAALPQNTFRFTWNGEGEIANGDTYATKYATGGDGSLNGWNGLGNGMLRHGYLAAGYKLQAYCHETNTYDLVEETKTFAVGSAFFIQVAADGDVQWTMANATVDRPLYAPNREIQETEEFRLSLFAEESEIVSDYLFCSASEDATEAYIIGHDLLKMGTPTDSKVARMWAKKGGKNLCDIEAALVNNKANCALGLYTPKAGSYWLAIDEAPEDASLYLTYNDAVIWDLTISPYLFDLSKGTTTGYGLRIGAKKTPTVTTDVEQSEFSGQSSVRKVIIDNKVYIVTPEGKMYDVIGKGVKF